MHSRHLRAPAFTPPCRVQLSFEPAFAGWGSPAKLRLGKCLSRHFDKIEPQGKGVGSKPRVQHHAHSRVTSLIP